MSIPASDHETSQQQFCLVQVGNLTCAVDLAMVVEINNGACISSAYGTNEYVVGVMNLRGTIMAIIDLRKRLGLSERADESACKILVVDAGKEKVGLLVDEVTAIIPIVEKNRYPSSKNINHLDDKYYNGIYRDGERLVVVLNTEGILY
ncbi:hypothetical protein SCG7086_AP_00120 [Chlamydiales bacterium SCGC AG-110-P3]|nr:hypothetical protein SCG7086_AP_00120 [Chlamydiales bacterium SCGC AG-110-P3]